MVSNGPSPARVLFKCLPLPQVAQVAQGSDLNPRSWESLMSLRALFPCYWLVQEWACDAREPMRNGWGAAPGWSLTSLINKCKEVTLWNFWAQDSWMLRWEHHVRKPFQPSGRWETTNRTEMPQPTIVTHCWTYESGHLGLSSTSRSRMKLYEWVQVQLTKEPPANGQSCEK